MIRYKVAGIMLLLYTVLSPIFMGYATGPINSPLLGIAFLLMSLISSVYFILVGWNKKATNNKIKFSAIIYLVLVGIITLGILFMLLQLESIFFIYLVLLVGAGPILQIAGFVLLMLGIIQEYKNKKVGKRRSAKKK